LAIGNRLAFTLVELMISLAMVLILILGINYVFRSATDAVSAGQNLNVINADSQSAQPVVFDDLRNVSKNPPCFIIASQLVTQFLNADDAKTGSDPTKMITDNAGTATVIFENGTSAGNTTYVSPAILGPRCHRADILKFFAHALYQRRTGNDGTYFGTETSDDAFIEYGHAALPTNDLQYYYGPSCLPNTTTGVYNGVQNFSGYPRLGAYASDWVLARRVTLMKDPSTITPTGDLFYQVAAAASNGIGGAFGANITPLAYGTLDSNSVAANQTQFQSSRYDLAGATPEEFDRIIANAILMWANQATPANDYSGTSLWWNPLVYCYQLTQTIATPPQSAALSSPPYTAPYYNAAPVNSGLPTITSTNPQTDPGLWYDRPQCNPTVQIPVTAASLAQMAPYFLQHCSQFIVEYAGDYMQQDQYGNMTNLGPDGQIDFFLDANGNKHIRWYGMPRSPTGALHSDAPSSANQVLIRGFDSANNETEFTSGSGASISNETTVTNQPSGTTIVTGGTIVPPTTVNTAALAPLNYYTDVIPLRDYYSLYYSTINQLGSPKGTGPTPYYAYPPWEADINFDCTHDYGCGTAAYTPPNGAGPNKIAFNDPNNPPRYVAAWHDDMPAMIRILVKVDDPNNKVKDGPWYEYVFRLK